MNASGIKRLCGLLQADQAGLAMIEFAFSVPIILLLGLGGVELANYALAIERVNQIAMTVADNAGRVRDSIDEMDVNEIMAGGKFMGQKIKFAQNGRIILSNVQNNPLNTGQWIRWQRCAGAKTAVSSYGLEKKGQKDSSLPSIGPVDNKIAASDGSIVMFVEVFYDYQPIVPADYLNLGNQTIHFTAAFNVRQRNPEVDKDVDGTPLASPPSDIKNTNSLSSTKISSCAIYSA